MDWTALTDFLLDRGVLGALAVVSGVTIWALFRLLITEKDKRLEDAKLREDGLMQPIKQLNENSTTQITLLRVILEKLGVSGKVGP